MSRLLYTVQNLVDEVRNQLDEQNVDSVNTEKDILPSLNRAQDYAFDIYARRYPEPILQHTEFPLVAGQQEYDIPENIFEDRILKIEMRVPTGGVGSTFAEVQQIAYRDLTNYESAGNTNIPLYFAVVGRKIRFVAPPTATYAARLWSLKDVEKLVLPQGRITSVNGSSNYVIVDQAGSSLTTEADNLGSYVNVINSKTGEIRGSLQIQTLNANNRLGFRSSPLRSDVLGREIGGSLADLDAAEDDYIAPIDGTCVPYYGRPTSNFLIQFAVNEITRKLGGQATEEANILEKFEKQVERTFAGRQQTLRVTKRSYIWGVPVRRWYWE
jgi:hypothetical protein